ncbi:MAG: transposase, partial [Bacteroidales bacterium]|nr:transposase [Bacteroidales bacterium]
WLKERGIRITASPMGRKPAKTALTYYQKRKARKEAAERNHIEGKFGQGKNGYELNEIRARLSATSESWVACIFFVMNLIHYQAKTFLCLFLRWITRYMDLPVLICLPLKPYLNQNSVMGTNTQQNLNYYKMVC